MMWWQWVAYGFIWVTLGVYTTWLYAVVLEDRKADREHFARVVGELRADIKKLAEQSGIDLDWEEPNPVEPPEADTVEMPAVKPEGPSTVEAEAADTFARQEVVLARHRPTEGARSVADILKDAGLEPLPGKRWRR